MTVFVSPPNRLPALLPNTGGHLPLPSGPQTTEWQFGNITLFSSLGSSQDVKSTHLPFRKTSHQSIELFTQTTFLPQLCIGIS